MELTSTPEPIDPKADVQVLLEVMEAGGSPAKQRMVGEHAEVCATALVSCVHTTALLQVRSAPHTTEFEMLCWRQSNTIVKT